MDRHTTPLDCAWVCDSPVSSEELPSMSKSSLPRCAVVNFRRNGDQVHVTPRAYRNSGGMACRVLKFEDAFQLEELSSRTFAFSKQNIRYFHDDESCLDVSAALSAVAEMGFDQSSPIIHRSSRRSTWARRLSSVLRRNTNETNATTTNSNNTTAEEKKRNSNLSPLHPWRSSSLGCMPMRRDHHLNHERRRASNASTIHSSTARSVMRRRTARHEMQLFENGTVLAEPPRGRREWRFRRFRKCRDLSPPNSKKHRASIDSYVLYMDDEL